MAQSRRLELHAILEATLGSSNVYFQPPPDFKMVYPCIVYERDNAARQDADNAIYHHRQRYQVTYIDNDPDSDVVDKLQFLPLTEYDRHFATSGLNHDVLKIYY